MLKLVKSRRNPSNEHPSTQISLWCCEMSFELAIRSNAVLITAVTLLDRAETLSNPLRENDFQIKDMTVTRMNRRGLNWKVELDTESRISSGVKADFEHAAEALRTQLDDAIVYTFQA